LALPTDPLFGIGPIPRLQNQIHAVANAGQEKMRNENIEDFGATGSHADTEDLDNVYGTDNDGAVDAAEVADAQADVAAQQSAGLDQIHGDALWPSFVF